MNFLRTMTMNQLYRLYCRVYDSLGSGGHFGWDWPTLSMVYPEKYTALKMLLEVMREKAVV